MAKIGVWSKTHCKTLDPPFADSDCRKAEREAGSAKKSSILTLPVLVHDHFNTAIKNQISFSNSNIFLTMHLKYIIFYSRMGQKNVFLKIKKLVVLNSAKLYKHMF